MSSAGGPSSISRWIALAAAPALAFARWYAMSTPDHFSGWLPAAWFTGASFSLTRAALNTLASWALLVALPAIVLLWAGAPLGLERAREVWGLGRPLLPSARWRAIALALPFAGAGVGAVAVLLVPAVSETYPIYRAAGDSLGGLLLSEALTLLLILATELYYRGAALFVLERGFGRRAIYLLLPIYALDHVGAPGAELAGSAVAGALLGHLALATRSLWPGFAAHAASAVTVDVLSALTRR